MTAFPLSFDEMWEKILACDSSYDPVFFTAVKTTNIYCRPSCKARKPLKINVTFYQNINDVEKAGFRACKRCQPNADQAPQLGLVTNVKAFLVEHYNQKLALQDIAKSVGVSSYYLDRLFKQHTSETPRAYLEKIRVDKAAHLLASTDLTNLEICYFAGSSSARLQNIETTAAVSRLQKVLRPIGSQHFFWNKPMGFVIRPVTGPSPT